MCKQGGIIVKRLLAGLLMVCLLLTCCVFGVSAGGEASVVVTDIAWSGANEPKPGASVVFSVELKNNGTADIAKGTAVKVDLYVNNEKVFTQNYDKGVAAGETVTVKFPKWKAVEGEHVITAVLNDTVPTKVNWVENQHLAANIRVADEALDVPDIAEKYGMTTLTFSDDFTTLDLVDKECTGAYGYKWYPNIPYGAKDAEPTDYELTEDGINLKRVATDFCWTLCTMDCITGAGWSYRHGYMEMRVRFPANRVIEGSEGKPSVWALPPEKIMSYPSAKRYVETDFLEVFDGDNYFTTTVHDLEFADESQTEYIHHYRNHNNQHLGMRDGEWHTMAFIRREGVMQCFLDGKEYMTLNWEDDKKSYPEAVIMKGEEDGTDAFSIADEQLLPLIISGNEGWPLEMDYIRVWEGDDKANQGESVEVAQFVESYLRDRDGQICLTADFENYETLISMEEAFAELSAEKKEELNLVIKREKGKNIAKVISDAKQFKVDLDAFVETYATDSQGELLNAEDLEACKTIVKGERRWEKMSDELKGAINTQVFLMANGAATYDDLLTAARNLVPASPIKAWMIAVAVLVLVGVVFGICLFCKKRKK